MPQPARTYIDRPELRLKEWPRKSRNTVIPIYRSDRFLIQHSGGWMRPPKAIDLSPEDASHFDETVGRFWLPSAKTYTRSEQDKREYSEDIDGEITVSAGLGLLLSDSWAVIRKYTISWMAIWGALVQLTAWLLGGFDAELKVTTALVILFLVTKALVHLKVGEFGLAFWRILHFPLWMTIIAIGTLLDLSHAEDATSMRKLAMIFVTAWCSGGSISAVMKLLGLERVEHLRKGFKKLIRETFADDDGG